MKSLLKKIFSVRSDANEINCADMENYVNDFLKQMEEELKQAMISYGHPEKYADVISKKLLPYLDVDIRKLGFPETQDAIIVFYSYLLLDDNYRYKVMEILLAGVSSKQKNEGTLKITGFGYDAIEKYIATGNNREALTLCYQAKEKFNKIINGELTK